MIDTIKSDENGYIEALDLYEHPYLDPAKENVCKERAEKDLGFYEERGQFTGEDCVYEEYGYDRSLSSDYEKAYDRVVEKHDKTLKMFADDDKL